MIDRTSYSVHYGAYGALKILSDIESKLGATLYGDHASHSREDTILIQVED
jgi:hypothetical protein